MSWISDATFYDYQFRFVIVGDSTVGKSSLLKYFISGEAVEDCEPTIGVDFYVRTIDFDDGVRIKLQLWDTAGQERFRSLTASYFRNCAGVLLVFDLTNRASFSNIPRWMEECRRHADRRHVPFILIGHKADLVANRQISKREATLFSNFHDLRYFETSSVYGSNIEEAFTTLSKEVHEFASGSEFKDDRLWDGIQKGHRVSVIQLKTPEEKEKEKCC